MLMLLTTLMMKTLMTLTTTTSRTVHSAIMKGIDKAEMFFNANLS